MQQNDLAETHRLCQVVLLHGLKIKKAGTTILQNMV